MGEEERARCEQTNKSGPVLPRFTTDRPSVERDYGLTILHCVTICPSFSPQARESLSPTTTDSHHCSFGGICAGVGRRHPTSDLVPCESARVREESERNKIDPLEEGKERRPWKKAK